MSHVILEIYEYILFLAILPVETLSFHFCVSNWCKKIATVSNWVAT